jgi:hypothetical protein
MPDPAALPAPAVGRARCRGVSAARALHSARATKENIMKIIASSVVSLALALATGCSKKGGSECEAIFDHTVSLMPELKDKLEQGREEAIKKCEKLSPEARKCALDASSMTDLASCPHK